MQLFFLNWHKCYILTQNSCDGLFIVPCIQSQLVSAWSLVAAHAGLYSEPLVFAHTSGGTDYPARLVAAGYYESGSVEDGKFGGGDWIAAVC